VTREFIENDAAFSEAVHGTFIPTDIRQTDSVGATVQGHQDAEKVVVRLWRISPAGIEFIPQEAAAYGLDDCLTLTIEIGKQTITHRGRVTALGQTVDKKPLVGTQFFATGVRNDEQMVGLRRQKIRWTCDPSYMPTGIADNPGIFNDRIYFRVVNLSNAGMRLVTSMRNKLVIPGLLLDAEIGLPLCGTIKVTLKLVTSNAATADNEAMHHIGAVITKVSPKDLLLLGQYILRFGSHKDFLPSPKRLKIEKYGTIPLGDMVDFSFVRTQQEYVQVTKLRSEAFQSVDGLGVVSSPEDMADVFDARSRIIIAKYRDKVIATLRVCFHGPEDLFEEEQYITFPSHFPRKDDMIEASRAATHRDYRGVDLFHNMMRFMMLTTLQSGRRYIIQSTYAALVPIYERIGFTHTGLHVPHPVFPGEKLHLLLGDARGVAEGQSGKKFTFLYYLPHIDRYLRNDATVKLGWVARNQMRIYKHSAPLMRIYAKLPQLSKKLKFKLKGPSA
jgi:predicted GNAT family N-acyltransferase